MFSRLTLETLLRRHGRAVALLLLGVLLPLALVAKLTEDVFRDGGFAWDQALLGWYRAHRTPGRTELAHLLAVVGGLPLLPLLTLGAAAVLARLGGRMQAWFLLLSLAGANLLNVAAKAVFQRPRPSDLGALVNEPGFSFPSGHTMSNAAVGVAVMLIFWRTRWRWPAALLGVGWALLVGASRNYLGVHYPTDVLVGLLSSTAWTVGLYLVLRRQSGWKRRESSPAEGVTE